MYELGVSVMPEALLEHQSRDRDLPRVGNSEYGCLFADVVAARGDEAWLAYSVADAAELTALARAVGMDVRRRPSVNVVRTRMREWAVGYTPYEAASILQSAGVAAGPVLDARDLLLDDQLAGRGFYELVDGIPGMGRRPIIGRPFGWRGGGIRPRVHHRAPQFAEHTAEVLTDVIARRGRDLAGAIEEGAVVTAPRSPLPARSQEYEGMLANGSIRTVGGDYYETIRDAIRALGIEQHRYCEDGKVGRCRCRK